MMGAVRGGAIAGTSAFYGTAPTLGNIAPDKRETDPADYTAALHAAWGTELGDKVAAQYPLERLVPRIQYFCPCLTPSHFQTLVRSALLCCGHCTLPVCLETGCSTILCPYNRVRVC